MRTSNRTPIRFRPAIDLGILIAATVAVYSPVLRNQFVNWDDPAVLVNNPHLDKPGVVAWAFTTTLIGHYQPLAWLSWSSARLLFGLSPAAFHGLGLAVHLVNGLLMYVITLRLAQCAELGPEQQRLAALVGALTFSIHPVQVEAVAWASAFPYVLAMTPLLLAFLAYLSGRRLISLACYGASLLTRANAIGFPILLLLVDIYPLRRRRRASLVPEKAPFIILAAAAVLAESRARELATIQEIGFGPRLTMAATAPFIYLERLVAPVNLSPLEPLAISPAVAVIPLVLGVTGVAAISIAAWKLRGRSPAFGIGWIAYVVMLAPVAGFLPSGLQSTADRYLYLPMVVVSLLVGIAIARILASSRFRVAGCVGVVAIGAALGAQTQSQVRCWRDSITLWTRAADLNPRNDVATYNLAIALAEAGREEDAVRRYEQTLQLVPDHDLARKNLNILQAAQAEREADRLAKAGRLDEAANTYAGALALDGNRLHARAARGVILMRRGRFEEAVPELRMAFDAHVNDPEVANALAFALIQSAQAGEAVVVLKRASAQYPDNVNLMHNLSRLLATAADPRVRDGDLALRLALEVRDRTGGRDPRALDTLAAAYAAVGRLAKARETAAEAITRARELGDVDAANEIAAHARSYSR